MHKIIPSFILLFAFVLPAGCFANNIGLTALQQGSQTQGSAGTSQTATTGQDTFVLQNGQIVSAGAGIICGDQAGGYCSIEESLTPRRLPIILTSIAIGSALGIYKITRRREVASRVVTTSTTTTNHRTTDSRTPGTETPEPGTILLLASGLGTLLAGAKRRRQRLAREV